MTNRRLIRGIMVALLAAVSLGHAQEETKKPTVAFDAGLENASVRAYRKIEGGELNLYILNPPNHRPGDKSPAIVFFFGGSWRRGQPSQFARQAQYFAARGMVAICADYRVRERQGTTPFECVADGKAAVRWIRSHAGELGIDPHRIAAAGGSAGGHVAVCAALTDGLEEPGADVAVSCVPDALVLYNPVIDTSEAGFGYKAIGTRWEEISPVHRVRAKMPPTLVFHGKNDRTVPFSGIERFVDEMKQRGNACQLMAFDGQGHGFYVRKEPFYSQVVAETDRFLAALGWISPSRPNAIVEMPVGQNSSDVEEAVPSASHRPVALSLPRVSSDPDQLRAKAFDLVVVGGTPSGIAMAVRAAREGLGVLLVQHTAHLGGMLANGLGLWDLQYRGTRAPLFDEVRGNIIAYYRSTYGEDSPQLKIARASRGRFEPKVAEHIFDRLVAAEKNLTVLRGWIPSEVEREGSLLRAVTFREYAGEKNLRIGATVFADATYEGDLFALAKVPYRVGRESRAEFAEPHAGQIFTRMVTAQPAADSVVGRLNVLKYQKTQEVVPGGTGEGDRAIQAYNFRVTLTNDPDNRILPEKPAGYDPKEFLNIRERWGVKTGSLPNNKGDWNAPILIEGNWDYPEADWRKREEITARHRDFALGLLWFLQNDPSLPEDKRREAQMWGLAKDEYADNGNMPYEMYVREARRIVGRAVFSEHDATLAPGLERAPIHADSIAATDWPLDSHECRLERRDGSLGDGKVLLTETTVPGQVSYRCLLPQGLDNLLVPMCLSATHVGWGAIRLEPTVMAIGESAAYAAWLSLQNKIAPAQLDSDALVRKLAEKGMLISFFNDVDLAGGQPWIPAVQYFGTKGFFRSYDARPDQPLSAALGKKWLELLTKLSGPFDPTQAARELPAEVPGEPAMDLAEFRAALKIAPSSPPGAVNQPLSRGEACRLMFEALSQSNPSS